LAAPNPTKDKLLPSGRESRSRSQRNDKLEPNRELRGLRYMWPGPQRIANRAGCTNDSVVSTRMMFYPRWGRSVGAGVSGMFF
jgi:hypothetical protein